MFCRTIYIIALVLLLPNTGTAPRSTVCMSREQVIASINTQETIVFEAVLLDHYIAPTAVESQEAFVRVTRVIQQPEAGWRLQPNEIAKIRDIRPYFSCLPKLIAGVNYLWITSNKADSLEDSALIFHEKGLFSLSPEPKAEPKQLITPPSVFDERLQHDAGYKAVSTNQSSVPAVAMSISPGMCQTVANCPSDLNPVCDVEGWLYQNECFLYQRACRVHKVSVGNMRQAPIKSVPVAQCIGRDDVNGRPHLCDSSNLCNYGALCPPKKTKETMASRYGIQQNSGNCDCTHLNCLDQWLDPVCATDGQTYSNQCFMQLSICATQSLKTVLYKGNCDSNPCLGHQCRWPGERCETDLTGKPKCVCPTPCPSVVLPVCGSDGVTYDSHCHLERTACQKMRPIWVVYAGQCSDENVCQSQRCQGFEICARIRAPPVYQRSENGVRIPQQQAEPPLVATCLCPVCPEKGLGDPVCGTDGQTYRSECHLRASVCQRHLPDIRVKSRGPCDACSSKECKFYAICQLNMDSEPQCICPTDCPYVPGANKVCGTDGKMYENICHLKVRSCSEQRDLQAAHEGPCKTCPHGCPLGHRCLNGECVCRDECPPSNSLEPEVCGSDGQLYRSECEMKRQACLNRVRVTVDTSGVGCRQARGWEGQQIQADGIQTPACRCSKFGAFSEQCDYQGRCECRLGAEGEKCDRCARGYWGILTEHSCIACSCHPDGAIGETCVQTTGQCDCRPDVLGRQCSICPEGGHLTKSGCIQPTLQPEPPNAVKQPETARPTTKVQAEASVSIQGRKFDEKTTLLVRAPIWLEQPVAVELHIVPANLEGSLLQYRMAPTKQEQMMLEHLEDHQFSLLLVRGGRVECRYVDGRNPSQTLVANTPRGLRLNRHHIVRAGVNNSRPWLRVDDGPYSHVTQIDVRQSRESRQTYGALHTGGYGTMVLGRPMLTQLSSTPLSDPNRINKQEEDGFRGCLLKFLVQAGSAQTTWKEVQLIASDPTDLVWIGVNRFPSGVSEAPLCLFTNDTKNEETDDAWLPGSQRIQSDARPSEEHNARVKVTSVCERLGVCQNNGICVPRVGDRDTYTCTCQAGWQGKHCEQEVTIIPQFNGDSFIRLPGPTGDQAMQRKRLHIKLVVLVTQWPGLIFFVPPADSANVHSPFIAVYLDERGHLVVVCRIGMTRPSRTSRNAAVINEETPMGLIMLRYKNPPRINEWNTLTIDKRAKSMHVQIDGMPAQQIRLVPRQFRTFRKRRRQQLTQFDLSKSPIYLGGYLFNPTQSPPPIDVNTGMVGAIQGVNINGAEVVLAGPPYGANGSLLLESPDVEQWINVSQWNGKPCGPRDSPCRANSLHAVCRPQGIQATCACATPVQVWRLLRTQGLPSLDRAEKVACEERQNQLLRQTETGAWSHRDGLQYDASAQDNHEASVDAAWDRVQTPRQYQRPPVRFAGHTVFIFEQLIRNADEYNIIIHLRLHEPDGLILSLIGAPNDPQQYSTVYNSQLEVTVIAVRQGQVEYSVSRISTQWDGRVQSLQALRGHVTSNLIQIRARTNINDGKMHSIQAVRSGRRATLLTDRHMVSGEFFDQFGQPDYGKNIAAFLGGTTTRVTGFPWEYQHNITACLSELYVNDQPVEPLVVARQTFGPVESCAP